MVSIIDFVACSCMANGRTFGKCLKGTFLSEAFFCERPICRVQTPHGMHFTLNRRENLKGMAKRLIQIRAILREKLEELDTPGDWSHITQQAGMYSYTGLTRKFGDLVQGTCKSVSRPATSHLRPCIFVQQTNASTCSRFTTFTFLRPAGS